MYRPYRKPVDRARADVKLPEPKVAKIAIFMLKLLGRGFLFFSYGIARILCFNDRNLFETFRRALAGESRCIIAFRHPNGGEPVLLAWFFLFRLRSLARRYGVKFPRQPHALFVYGYEVARWGGWVARFMLNYSGAMPVHHSKIDRSGMTRIFNAIINGRYPLAIAPEGQVSYTSDTIPHLEQGVIWMGFGAAERLEHSGSKIPVEVLPLSIHYRFGSWGVLTVELLLRRIERFTSTGDHKERRKLPFAQRLAMCRDYILEINEKRYGITIDTGLTWEKRLDAVIDAALENTENILGVKTSGDFFTRMNNLRQVCWDRMVLPGVDSLDNMTRVERGAHDLRAGEAWHASRHIELVYFAWYFRVPLPDADTPLHNRIEYTQNLWDFVNRTIGGAYQNRISILPRKVIIQSAPPINLSERLPSYREKKSETIEQTMNDLENAYLDCIKKLYDTEKTSNRTL